MTAGDRYREMARSELAYARQLGSRGMSRRSVEMAERLNAVANAYDRLAAATGWDRGVKPR